MNTPEDTPRQKDPRQPRSLNRYIKRISVPSAIAGAALVAALGIFYVVEDEPRTPQSEQDTATEDFRQTASVAELDSEVAPAPNSESAKLNPILVTIEPALNELESKIENLSSADEDNWKSSRSEVVDAWSELESKYDALKEELAEG